MIQLDEKKLAKLKTTNQLLDEKYGKHGTASVNLSMKGQWRGIMVIYFGNGAKNLN